MCSYSVQRIFVCARIAYPRSVADKVADSLLIYSVSLLAIVCFYQPPCRKQYRQLIKSKSHCTPENIKRDTFGVVLIIIECMLIF